MPTQDYHGVVNRFNRIADAVVEPLITALDGHCIDDDFSLSEHRDLRDACRRVVFRALAADSLSRASDASLYAAEQALRAGFRVLRLGRAQFVINLKAVHGVAYSVDVVAKYWPDFPVDLVDEVEFLTSLEG